MSEEDFTNLRETNTLLTSVDLEEDVPKSKTSKWCKKISNLFIKKKSLPAVSMTPDNDI